MFKVIKEFKIQINIKKEMKLLQNRGIFKLKIEKNPFFHLNQMNITVKDQDMI